MNGDKIYKIVSFAYNFLKELTDAFLQYRMDEIRRSFHHEFKNEQPLMHTRVRNSQPVGRYDQIIEKYQVAIEGAGFIASVVFRSAEFALGLLQQVEQLFRSAVPAAGKCLIAELRCTGDTVDSGGAADTAGANCFKAVFRKEHLRLTESIADIADVSAQHDMYSTHLFFR